MTVSEVPPWVVREGGLMPYEAVVEPVDAARWDAFGHYYLQGRGAAAEEASRIVQEIRGAIATDELAGILAALLKSRTSQDLTGQLGEIVGSFVLEARHGALLHGLTWPVAPFDVRRGMDISGVCTHSWKVLCIEAKATTLEDLRNQVTRAKEGLLADGLWKRFSVPLDDGHSRQASVSAVRRALRTGRLDGKSIGPGDVESLIDSDSFVRVGVIVHASSRAFDYSGTLAELELDDLTHHGETATSATERAEKRRLPTVFVDVRLDDFERALNGWIELERLLKDAVY